jgi:hypothetical protein
MKHRNQYNSKNFQNDGEKNFPPSLTIPDQTLSIKEILERYARGLPMDGKVPIYEGEDGDGIDPRRLDLSERAELQIQYTQELNEIKKSLEKQSNPENTVSPAGTEGEIV